MQQTLLSFMLVGHVVLGVGGTLAVYKALEQNWMSGWLFSICLAGATVYGEWRLGEALLSGRPPVQNEELVVGAIVGGRIGVLSTVVLSKPDVTREFNEQDFENNGAS